ncbi:AEC family transporter [Desulforhopalus vacuolatus]|uniref:AEC family transporter n=1 Tax=Desulforhopalus vacuolatus TaxID=40414 RepID=UPI0019636EA1|nr:AEC family transporter [Desulforhopalus vacuolatus]MBM9520769.1 AEC family transporter [Desulforhopalus vacuolatus]
MAGQIFLIILPVFLVIVVGLGLKQVGLLHDRLVNDLNRFVYYAALPALLFQKIATADFGSNFSFLTLAGLLAAIFLTFIFASLWTLGRKYPPVVQGAFVQASVRGNLAYVGLAVINAVFGAAGVTKAGILLGFLVPCMSIVSILALLLPWREKGQKFPVLEYLREIAFNPMFIGPVLGILWSWLRLPLPEVMAQTLHIFTGMTLPVALICTGASFSFQRFKGSAGTAILSSVIKVAFLPLLAALILFAFKVRGDDLAIATLLAGTPTATVCSILASQLRGDSELSSAIILITTCASAFTCTAILYFLKMTGNLSEILF